MEAVSHDSPTSVRVNVSLCGSIPRKDMAMSLRHIHAPLTSLSSSDLNAPFLGHESSCKNGSNDNLPLYKGLLGLVAQNPSMARIHHEQMQPSQPLLEPPSWAVPARGEARLEPVCEAVGRQKSVDLTSKASFRIGRSPNSDVQLLHATSSRRHAIVFHHANGSCYVVDCGSAHGTYVNGVRIALPPRGGVVMPTKVRRGAMIRFGGPGAPCFVLKSFASEMDISEPLEQPIEPKFVSQSNSGDIVRLNTRINALGSSSFEDLRLPFLSMTCNKRSSDSLSSENIDSDERCVKRMRCSSPPLFPEEPIRLVSPDIQTTSAMKRRVTFSEDPPSTFYPALVTPEELSDEEDG